MECNFLKSSSKYACPGDTIGILGSGQLGRMFAIAARQMGYRIHVLSPDSNSPTGQIADKEFTAAYEDLDAVRQFAQGVDVVTYEFENVPAETAVSRNLQVIIAGAGGAAHLPGMVAAQTTVPVLGVPVQSHAFNGLDSLLSIVQMPGGIPVGTLAIGKAGAKNAALLAIAILGNQYPEYREKLEQFRQSQTDKVLSDTLPAS